MRAKAQGAPRRGHGAVLTLVGARRTLPRMADTLVLSPDLMRSLERRAAERGTTPAALVEALVRRELDAGGAGAAAPLPPLPTFDMGEALVDLSDREAMDEVLNGERDRRLYGRRPAQERPADA